MLNSKTVSDFIAAARNYCAFIELEPGKEDGQFLPSVQKQLLTLYSLGLSLPAIKVSDDNAEEAGLAEMDRERLRIKIGERLPFAYYWVILNPLELEHPAKIGAGDLIDDLCDLYFDLKKGLLLLDQEEGDAKTNAVWHFKFDFEHHWGEHCMQAMSAIHYFIAGFR